MGATVGSRQDNDGGYVNVVDWLMVGAVIVFALVGWRQGFVAGALSFLGFLGGGLLAVLWLPDVIERFVTETVWRIIAIAIGVLASALVGQVLLSTLGRRLRSSITWRPIRFVDNLGGAALNVLALALVAWIIASVVAFLPRNDVTRHVTNSIVLTNIDQVLPEVARSSFGSLRDVVGETAVPRVFAGLVAVPGDEVDPPVPDAARGAVAVIRDSTVRLSGVAEECDTIVTGSGFAIEPNMIVTNAHVVAGVTDLVVRVRPGQSSRSAEVVYFDPRKDVAIVAARALEAKPVRLSGQSLDVGQSVVVAGYPRGEGFQASPARVRAQVRARGESIYGDSGVEREVYVLRGNVEQGNSGGPLSDEFGEVHGMVFASGRGEDEVAYALTVEELLPAIDAARDVTAAVPNGSCQLR